jgi:hypothetical protein
MSIQPGLDPAQTDGVPRPGVVLKITPRALGAIASVALLVGGIVGSICMFSRTKPAPDVKTQVVTPTALITTAPRASGSTGTPPWNSWPPQEVVVGPPAGWPEKTPPKAAPSTVPSARAVEAQTPVGPEAAALRGALLDPKGSSAQKLALIEALKSRPAEESVPILAAFIEGTEGASSRAAKPSAVKALADMKNPLADHVLSRLSYASGDEQVRLTIVSLWAKERSK